MTFHIIYDAHKSFLIIVISLFVLFSVLMPTSASHAVIPAVMEGNSILASLPQQAIVQLAQASATAAIATSRIYQDQQQPSNATTPTKVKLS